MKLANLLLPEFDAEMATTRKLLERVPEEHGRWKPHDKAFPLGHLAQLVAMLPMWVVSTLNQTELDLNPPDKKRSFAGYTFEPTEKLLGVFDDGVAKGRAALAAATDEDMWVPWTLKSGGHAVLTQPRYTILRQTVINHLVHHRGQLSTYLRMLDVKIPMIYGPTADEKFG